MWKNPWMVLVTTYLANPWLYTQLSLGSLNGTSFPRITIRTDMSPQPSGGYQALPSFGKPHVSWVKSFSDVR